PARHSVGGGGALRTSPAVIASASEIYRLASAGGHSITDSPRPGGTRSQTRLACGCGSHCCPATACGSHCRSPEFLPFDGLAVDALGAGDVVVQWDHRLAPADVGDEPGDAGDQTRDRPG